MLLWDMTKFYENFSHERLVAEARKFGFPTAITQLCVSAYRYGRFVSMASAVAGPFFARRGVVAGCSMATSLVR
eukprot:3992454-Pyramimonas_sp.AAC.1